MIGVLLRRIGQGIVTVLILTGFVFVMTRLTGSPLDIILPFDASQELRDRVAEQLGLNRSLVEQYLIYIWMILRGDLGNSFRYGVPVTQLFFDRLPNSMALIIPAFVIAWIMAVPLGVTAATTRFRIVDKGLSIISAIALATPVFWIGVVFILIFSVTLKWLPSSRMGDWRHYVLPIITLVLFIAAGIMRLVRSSMLESMNTEYVTLARLKGLSERRVIWLHALRSSLTSGVSFLGLYFAHLITGSVVIEKVFAWPGAGQLLFAGISARDYPLVQGVILLTSVLIIVTGIIFDIIQSYLDPRTRL
jgi:peptide/nickel transport system permease protein